MLREKEAQNRRELDQKHLERKVRERKRKNSSESKDEPKKKLTEKEQKQKIAEDEATLRGDEDQGINFKCHFMAVYSSQLERRRSINVLDGILC